MLIRLLTVMVLLITLVAYPATARAQEKGQFKGQCLPSGTSMNDPIMKPDATMEHIHNFWGNTGVPVDAEVDTLEEMRLQGTSCEDGTDGGGGVTRDNRSSYWAPQIYFNGSPITPVGSGFYYSSKGGLNPAVTKVTPFGLKLIVRHRATEADPRQAAEIDVACPAGSLTQAQQVPDGKNTMPAPGECRGGEKIDVGITFPECLDEVTLANQVQRAYRAVNRGLDNAHCAAGLTQIPTLQAFLTYQIPPESGYFAGPTSLTIAGMGGTQLPWGSMHADYFNAEDLSRMVDLCINRTNAGDPRCK